jgi:hypothetical protein
VKSIPAIAIPASALTAPAPRAAVSLSSQEIKAQKESIKQSMEALAAELKDCAEKMQAAIAEDKMVRFLSCYIVFLFMWFYFCSVQNNSDVGEN